MGNQIRIILPEHLREAFQESSDWGPLTSQGQFSQSAEQSGQNKRISHEPVKSSTSLVNHPFSRIVDWLGLSIRHTHDISTANLQNTTSSQDSTFEIVDYRQKKKNSIRSKDETTSMNTSFRSNVALPAHAAQFQKKLIHEKGIFTSAKRVSRKSPTFMSRGMSVGHLSSLLIKEHWILRNHLSLSTIAKVQSSITSISPPKDLSFHGFLPVYSNSFDYIDGTSSKPVALKASKCVHHYVTPIEDPVMREIVIDSLNEMGDSESDSCSKVFIVSNDAILATLMTSPRSIFSFDFRVTKSGGVIFFDWRDDDDVTRLSTVDETSSSPPHDHHLNVSNMKTEDTQVLHSISGSTLPICSATSLAREAFRIGENASQLMTSDSKKAYIKMSEGAREMTSNPFESDEQREQETEVSVSTAKVFYRYRKWIINVNKASGNAETEMVVLCRTTLDGTQRSAVQDSDGKTHNEPIRIFAVNEHEGSDRGQKSWKNKIANGKGAILANFVKSNACKVAKWVTMSLLCGAEKIKIAFVSRTQASSSRSHTIIGVDTKTPKEFAAQVGLKQEILWNTLTSIVEKLLPLADGSYSIAKESGKSSLSIYEVIDSVGTGDSSDV